MCVCVWVGGGSATSNVDVIQNIVNRGNVSLHCIMHAITLWISNTGI